RYERQLVNDAIATRIPGTGLQNDRCLVVYLDEAAPAGTPNLIPCRFGRVTKSEAPGTIVTLRFQLEGYAYAHDLAGFRQEFQDLSLTSDQGKCELFVTDIPLALVTVVESRELDVWQALVSQLATRPTFSGEDFFFTL